MKFVKRVWSFKEMTIQKVLNNYPHQAKAILYFPDLNNVQKLDKTYTCNVL